MFSINLVGNYTSAELDKGRFVMSDLPIVKSVYILMQNLPRIKENLAMQVLPQHLLSQ